MEEVVGFAEEDFPGARARLEDTALLDFVNDAMREATGADLSMTSLLPGRFEGFRKGPIKVRNVYTLYPYENQLVEIEIDGATLRACLEHAAEFYGSAAWEDGKLVLKPKEGMIPYNFDVVQGASYRIDPTAPVGSRIKDLAYKGRPVQPADRFTLAVNAYRAQGSGGYKALRGAKVVKEIPDEIRELLIERLRKLGTVRPRTDHNWVVAPDDAWAPEAPRRAQAN
jgi:2',3'-cyclic-nucleotide 2'-phosphodiesterase/3'-nucleotidase